MTAAQGRDATRVAGPSLRDPQEHNRFQRGSNSMR